MFSIVIPLYNKESEIQKTLNSVFNQTFQEFEIIIVNDGSTDRSENVVNKFTDKRIKLINQNNSGVSEARNRGVREAKNDWIAFLDADDLWQPNHLSVLKKSILNNPGYFSFCTSYIRTGQEIPKYKQMTTVVIQDYYEEALIKGHFFWTSVVCVHKKVFKKVGVFNTLLSRGEDLDLWCRIADDYKIVKANIVTAEYVLTSNNKLTKSSHSSKLNQSILNSIDFKELKGVKKKYFKKLVLKKLKSTVLNNEWNLFFEILLKYHFYVV